MSVAAVAQVLHAFFRREHCELFADASPQVFSGSWLGLTEQCFQFGEHLFDRVEVMRVGRQEHQLGTASFCRLANAGDFVAAQPVGEGVEKSWSGYQPSAMLRFHRAGERKWNGW